MSKKTRGQLLNDLYEAKHTGGDISDREKALLDEMSDQNWREFMADYRAKEARKKAGKASGAARRSQIEVFREEWLQVARATRKHNPGLTVADIAARVHRHMVENESEYDTAPTQSVGTIRNYLYKNL